MNSDVSHLLWKRLDKMEEKIDLLLESRWKSIGALWVLTILFNVVLAFIKWH